MADIKPQEQKKLENHGEDGYIIEYDRGGCIGAGACVAVLPDIWAMDADGKANMKGKKDNLKIEITKEDFQVNFEAAESCPVNVIHIIDKKTGKKII